MRKTGVELIGSFKQDRGMTTKIYQFLFDYFKLDSLPFTWKEDTELTCKLVLQAKKYFLRIFPSSDFKVIFHPLYSIVKNNRTEYFKKCLKKNQMGYIFIDKPADSNDFIFEDGHPNAKANEYLAKEILKKIESI